jgi:hypothetical protein
MGRPSTEIGKQSPPHRFSRCISTFCLALVAVCAAHPSQSSDLVSIGLEGEIEAECQLHLSSAAANLGQIGASGSKLIPFILNCNTPFAYHVHSRERGLKHSGLSAQQASFAALLPYTLDLRIPTDMGILTEQCISGSLGEAPTDCGNGASGGGIAISQNGSLTISWSTDRELLPGVYSDVLTFTVRPQL